jgi:hypothetical protein
MLDIHHGDIPPIKNHSSDPKPYRFHQTKVAWFVEIDVKVDPCKELRSINKYL